MQRRELAGVAHVYVATLDRDHIVRLMASSPQWATEAGSPDIPDFGLPESEKVTMQRYLKHRYKPWLGDCCTAATRWRTRRSWERTKSTRAVWPERSPVPFSVCSLVVNNRPTAASTTDTDAAQTVNHRNLPRRFTASLYL